MRLVTQSTFSPSKLEMQQAIKAVCDVAYIDKNVPLSLMNEQDVYNTSKGLDKVISLCEEAKRLVGKLNK